VFRTVVLPTSACLCALSVKSVETWRWMATNELSNRKPGARSQNFRSKPEPEVVLAAILYSESAKCRENARKQWQIVGMAVPYERALTKIQFGVPFQTGSRINSSEVVTRMREAAQSTELRAAEGEM